MKCKYCGGDMNTQAFIVNHCTEQESKGVPANLLNKMQIRHLGAADCICHFDFVVMLPPLKRIDKVNKDSLERCYKTVLKQRDNYHVSQVELISLVDSLVYELDMAIDEINTMRDLYHKDSLTPADHWDKEGLHNAQVKLHELGLVT